MTYKTRLYELTRGLDQELAFDLPSFLEEKVKWNLVNIGMK